MGAVREHVTVMEAFDVVLAVDPSSWDDVEGFKVVFNSVCVGSRVNVEST
jgi:hypothetical protein